MKKWNQDFIYQEERHKISYLKGKAKLTKFCPLNQLMKFRAGNVTLVLGYVIAKLLRECYLLIPHLTICQYRFFPHSVWQLQQPGQNWQYFNLQAFSCLNRSVHPGASKTLGYTIIITLHLCLLRRNVQMKVFQHFCTTHHSKDLIVLGEHGMHNIAKSKTFSTISVFASWVYPSLAL